MLEQRRRVAEDARIRSITGVSLVQATGKLTKQNTRFTWRGVRVAEGARLESVYTARYRGFESLSLRHNTKGPVFRGLFYYGA